MATLGLNTQEYERSSPQGGALPPGIYTLTVVRVQQKQTNDRTGVYEEVEFDIQSPSEYSNRKFWDRFNIINKSPKAQQIGREGIADLAKASGINGIINDDQELLGKTVQAKLVIEASDNPQYPEPKNRCKKYYPAGINVEEAEVSKSNNTPPINETTKPTWGNTATPSNSQPQKAVSGATAPWKR